MGPCGRTWPHPRRNNDAGRRASLIVERVAGRRRRTVSGDLIDAGAARQGRRPRADVRRHRPQAGNAGAARCCGTEDPMPDFGQILAMPIQCGPTSDNFARNAKFGPGSTESARVRPKLIRFRPRNAQTRATSAALERHRPQSSRLRPNLARIRPRRDPVRNWFGFDRGWAGLDQDFSPRWPKVGLMSMCCTHLESLIAVRGLRCQHRHRAPGKLQRGAAHFGSCS